MGKGVTEVFVLLREVSVTQVAGSRLKRDRGPSLCGRCTSFLFLSDPEVPLICLCSVKFPRGKPLHGVWSLEIQIPSWSCWTSLGEERKGDRKEGLCLRRPLSSRLRRAEVLWERPLRACRAGYRAASPAGYDKLASDTQAWRVFYLPWKLNKDAVWSELGKPLGVTLL